MTNEDDYNTKTVSRYLMYDWRDDKLRTRQTKPSKDEISPYEQPFELSLEVKVPEVKIPEISAAFEVPETNVKEVIVDQLELQAEPEDNEFPEPSHLMVHHEEDIRERWEDFEQKFDDGEFGETWTTQEFEEESLEFLRSCHTYERQNNNRSGVLVFLEKKILELGEDSV